MAVPPPSGRLVTQHALMRVRYRGERGVRLTDMPCAAYRDVLTHPSDYGPTQAFGRALREAGVDRCRPWRAERGPVVPGRRRRGRVAEEAKGAIVPKPRRHYAERIRDAVKPFAQGSWRGAAARRRARAVAMP